LTADQGCPEKCSYTKEGTDQTEIWCIAKGPYQSDNACSETTSMSILSSMKLLTTEPHLQTLTTNKLSTLPNCITTELPLPSSMRVLTTELPLQTATANTISTTQLIITTEPPPQTPNVTTRVKVKYEEDGEIFEQEDVYNNVTGEAKIIVPAHGNNSAIEVIMQESTVRKILSLLTFESNINIFQGTLVTAGYHSCEVSSVPDHINTAAIQVGLD
jgi:hypothetical protein